MFRFGVNEALFGLMVIPLLGALIWSALTRSRRALLEFGDAPLVRRLSASVSWRGRVARRILVLTAVALLVVAFARPQFGTRVETVRRRGMDVVVALDLSASMLAEDIRPSRLEKAKLAIADLIHRLDGDRIGLVAFAGEAFLQSPLTLDYAAAALFLNAMEPDIVSAQGTNLGAALSVSLDAYDDDTGQDRVLIVITDGEDHEGAVAEPVERTLEKGARTFAVGMGTPDGVPIPEFDAAGRRRGFKRDSEGNVVTTRLDETTLMDIAERTGGRYYRATPGGSELDQLAKELTGAEGRELEAQQVTRFEEQFQIFLGLALALLIAELLVPDRRGVAGAWAGRFR